MENTSCYTFKKYTYTDGLLNDSVDATYILHLEGNGRLDSIEKQIEEYHPTNIVYIMFNKGFKKCEKTLKKQNSVYDLNDAYYQAFIHSNSQNYSNVLVLEDDFIFNPEIKNTTHIHHINNFVKRNETTNLVYQLGTVPFIIFPVDLYNFKCIIAGGMHASIFSKVARNKYINEDSSNTLEMDVNICLNYDRYMYYTPLCYQTFPPTENSKNWFPILGEISMAIYKIMNLDKEVEPGTSNMYIIAKMLFAFFFLLLLFFIHYLLERLKVYTFLSKSLKRVLDKRKAK